MEKFECIELSLDKLNEQILIYKEQQRVVDVIRAEYEKIKHHKELTAKIMKGIKAALAYVGPYSAYMAREYGQVNIKVWKGSKQYDVYMCMSERALGGGWNAVFEHELERVSYNDAIEELEYERQYFKELHKIEAQIIALKDKAEHIKKPFIPKTATIRAEAHFWSSVSYTTQKIFKQAFSWKD